ncbi:MAG: phosphoribosylanthranilate isomerase [Pseudomonadota bacterium]
MTKVKICGLTRPADTRAAVEAGADLVGCIVHPQSKRAVRVDDLPEVMAPASARAARVAVVVDPDDALAATLASSGAVDWLQLHGEETAERVVDLKRRTGLRMIKALAVATGEDVDQAEAVGSVADLVLFDARPAPGAPRGGNGLAFDWRLLDGLAAASYPWGLAGGLDPSNVAGAIGRTGAGLVDVASGVETAPGQKDHDAIRAFVSAAKRRQERAEEPA